MKIFVKVKPNASINEVVLIDNNHLEVSLTAPAEKGKANIALIKLLSQYFKVAPSAISIIKGAKNRQKVLAINI